MSTTFRWRAVVSRVTLALWALGIMGTGTATAFGQGEAESLSAGFRTAARRVLPSVVTVKAEGRPSPFEGGPPGGPGGLLPPGPVPDATPRPAGGSGVVINAEKGYVLTNDHVVQGSPKVVVILDDGRERPVSQVRRDPKSDLALLIIDGKDLTQAEWGDSEALDIGDWVLAVGQPFGLSGTVTAGIVSGKKRGIGVAMYEDLIQTDAAINPGNSGGPLINMKGELVGINTAIKTLNGGYEGIGFAIPAARARRVVADLVEHGRVRRSYLGIQIGPVDQDQAERLGQPRAVQVNGVAPDSPASSAGLIRGDVILSVDGEPVAGVSALQSAIEFAATDQPLTLTIERDGERKEVKVTPRAQPESFGLPERFDRPEIPGPRGGPGAEPPLEFGPGARRPARPRGSRDELVEPRETRFLQVDVPFPVLGLRLSDPSAELGRRFRLAHPPHGVRIVGVERGGPADRGGLEPGMLLTRIGDRDVENLEDVRKALADAPAGKDMVIRILRGAKAEVRVIPEPRIPKSDSKESSPPGREPDSATP